MERTASAENTQTSPPKKQGGQTERSTPMKEMNRREFLTLSGAAVVALSLAGCGGPSSPPSPPASESKEMALFKAINEVWYEVNREVITHPDLKICKSLVYCQEAADLAKFTASPFENNEPEVDEEDYRKWSLPDDVFHEYQRRESEMIEGIREKYGNGSYRGTAGVSNYTHDGLQLEQLYPRNPSESRRLCGIWSGMDWRVRIPSSG